MDQALNAGQINADGTLSANSSMTIDDLANPGAGPVGVRSSEMEGQFQRKRGDSRRRPL